MSFLDLFAKPGKTYWTGRVHQVSNELLKINYEEENNEKKAIFLIEKTGV